MVFGIQMLLNEINSYVIGHKWLIKTGLLKVIWCQLGVNLTVILSGVYRFTSGHTIFCGTELLNWYVIWNELCNDLQYVYLSICKRLLLLQHIILYFQDNRHIVAELINTFVFDTDTKCGTLAGLQIGAIHVTLCCAITNVFSLVSIHSEG